MSRAVDAYGPSCDLVPGVLRGVRRGYYLVAANCRVEAGPFGTIDAAHAAAVWLEDQGRGVHPAPWRPVFARSGLLIGTRLKAERLKVLTG